MAEFPTWGWFELKITIGETLTAVSALIAAWWVGKIIQGRHAADRAIRDLVVSLTNDALEMLSCVSETLDRAFPKGAAQIEDEVRRKITRDLTRFSNSIHTIETAASEVQLKCITVHLHIVKEASETLRSQVLDPLVTGPGLDGSELRQINGTMLTARESLVRLQLKAMGNDK